MRRSKLGKSAALLCLCVAAWCGTSGEAAAQNAKQRYTQDGITNPPISPYLNFFNNNNSPAQNYFNFVSPQLEMRNEASRLQREIGTLDRGLSSLKQQPNATADKPLNSRRLSTTGHATSFGSTGGYFGGRTGR
jgi:hypothetical protein